ncbi:LysR family transcriptional regulator [Paraburkholderia fungorum]|uniref:LysR family transcriptional regulator n=1 Tax=Paraburkholderia fungorum TaxID=134537 RepID=UPI00402BE317
MDRLQAMKVFTRVVETNSFTRAADSLGLPRASVSVIIQQLETYLKVRLLHRTTRRLNLTPDGAAYYERSVRVLADIDDIESSLENRGMTPRGKIRVDMPSALGRTVLMPRVHEFHAKYPDVELMLGFSDKPVDLIQEGVDCVIRIGALQDSTLVARRIGLYQGVTVASPRYLEQFGTPRTIEDLHEHTAVNYFWARTGRFMEFTFDVDGHAIAIPMKGRVSVNDAEAYVAGALEGIGIIQAARFMALPHMQAGSLVELLEQWKPMPMPISAVYPHNRHLSPTVRVFVDWVAELFSASDLFSSSADSERLLRSRASATGGLDGSIILHDGTEQPVA